MIYFSKNFRFILNLKNTCITPEYHICSYEINADSIDGYQYALRTFIFSSIRAYSTELSFTSLEKHLFRRVAQNEPPCDFSQQIVPFLVKFSTRKHMSKKLCVSLSNCLLDFTMKSYKQLNFCVKERFVCNPYSALISTLFYNACGRYASSDSQAFHAALSSVGTLLGEILDLR